MHMFSREAIPAPCFHNMVGRSAPMYEVFELIRMVAPTKAPVLIVGETGTGKELVARAIHNHSIRRNKPFVAVNCSATADALWESEMFGHERGAFTGAVFTKKGRFELANQGTLFLDEISEMSTALQRKSLRALQEMEFERVGGTSPIKVEVRFIAAANRDPKKGVQEGWFRQDLYYRLNVVRIQIPPLKDRKDDIPLLAYHFLEKYVHENNKTIEGISRAAIEILMDYSFPGNIRELENAVQRAVILAKGKVITPSDLPEELLKESSPGKVDAACPDIKSGELLKSLEKATICNNGGPPKLWRQTLRTIDIETIHEFLLNTNTRLFSRHEFADFLSHKAKSDRNKYGTAGKYLSILKKNRICVHNNKKANQSRYRLSEVFLT